MSFFDCSYFFDNEVETFNNEQYSQKCPECNEYLTNYDNIVTVNLRNYKYKVMMHEFCYVLNKSDSSSESE